MKIKHLAGLGLMVGVVLGLGTGTPVLASGCTRTVSNTNDSGVGSLRQAILDSNAASDLDMICFSISTGHQQIIPSSPMPPITQPAVIDGSTQPGFNTSTNIPLIELSGNGAGVNAIGLRVTGNGAGSTIKALIINRFSANGIFLDSSNNTIIGNYIGVAADGSSGAGNAGDGIGIFSGTSAASANGNVIGGSTSANRNVISGNGVSNVSGANGIGITAQNGGNANSNIVKGNYIGTNAAGAAAIPNQGDGVLVNQPPGGGAASATGNIIGGSNASPGGACTGDCNLLSGNAANGAGLWHAGASGNTVSGNYVGTNAAGITGVGNGNIGLEINEAPNNTAGGTTPAARNVFSGNGGAGVFLTGAAETGSVVEGNYIGTNAAGTAGIGNVKMGIGVGASPGAVGANSDTIGGTTGTTPGTACAGACNLISGNGQDGIFITGSESSGHQILGNYIGLNASGTIAIGNTSDGIGILNTPNLSIGNGTNAGQNIIGSNGANGVVVAGAASTGNRIDTNIIGFLGFGNTASGVAVSGATDTAILRNSIFYNGILGIDLDDNGTPNLNSPGGPHTGANHLQNFPNIYAVRTIGTTSKIGGQFNSIPNTTFSLDFFYSSGCNGGPPKNYGQGQNYIGSTDVSTDQFGNSAFGFTAPSTVPGNTYVTATATMRIGNVAAETSEFSKCVLVNAPKPALTNGATWFLKDYLISGPGDQAFNYGFPSQFLMCAWDPNQPGVKLPVIFINGSWFMRASYTTGAADLSFSYGSSDSIAICGDWNGDGIDTVGVVSPNRQWELRNSNSGGPPDAGNFQYGGSGTRPLVGDWDGNGTDTIGVVDSSNNWKLRNTNSSGAPDLSFNYGFTPGYPVVGDWDGNGTDTVGSVSSGGTWAIRNSNSPGAPDGTFQFGFPGTTPLIW